MLTTEQKEKILRLAGIKVPDYPRPEAAVHSTQQQQGTSNLSPTGPSAQAAAQWTKAIETLFVQYSAERAARSLRESEEARQLDMLQRAQVRRPR